MIILIQVRDFYQILKMQIKDYKNKRKNLKIKS